MKIATFDVDAQKGFTPLCPTELPVPEGDTIVSALNEMAKLGVIRVGSKDCHPVNAIWVTDKPERIMKPVRSIFPDIADNTVDVFWPAHCTVGTYGNELLNGLPKVTDYDFFVFKGTEPDLHPYGACFHDLHSTLSTGVIEFLKSKEITHVLVGGLALNFCVHKTATQLAAAGFTVGVVLEACKAIGNSTESEKNLIAEGITLFNKVEAARRAWGVK